jgi:hypothetical protein
MAVFFGWWGHGAYTHHRFLQCQYRPLWRETGFKLRERTVLVTLPIEVDNPSRSSIDPTELTMTIQGEGILAGSVLLEGPMIRGGESAILRLVFAADLSEEALLNLPEFLRARYSGHLKLEPPLSKPVLLKIFPQ